MPVASVRMILSPNANQYRRRDGRYDAPAFTCCSCCRKHTLKIVTAPGQPHEFTFFQLMPGKTAADIPKYVEAGMKGPPPAMAIGGVAGVAAGIPSYYEVDLKPGDYAIVCFLEDAKDGKPHFVHGMIQQIKIT